MMAGFKFRYDTLLRHRRGIEDQRQRDLAQLMRSRMIFHNELSRMQKTITESKRQLGDTLIGKVNVDRVGQFARYSGQVEVRGRQLIMRLAQLEKRIVGAREKLLEAVRQRKALEQLRDKDHLAWRRELERREIAELDDLTTQRYAHAMISEAAE